MDPLTHPGITAILIDRHPSVLVAGLAADFAWYVTYPAWLAYRGSLTQAFKTNNWPDPPPWMIGLHRAPHSAILAVLAATAIRMINGKWPTKHLAAWLLHIAVDLPTHSRDPWGPRPFWPLSDFALEGVSWAETAVDMAHRLISKARLLMRRATDESSRQERAEFFF